MSGNGVNGTQADKLKYYLLKWIVKGYYDKEDTGILQSCKEYYIKTKYISVL